MAEFVILILPFPPTSRENFFKVDLSIVMFDEGISKPEFTKELPDTLKTPAFLEYISALLNLHPVMSMFLEYMSRYSALLKVKFEFCC